MIDENIEISIEKSAIEDHKEDERKHLNVNRNICKKKNRKEKITKKKDK